MRRTAGMPLHALLAALLIAAAPAQSAESQISITAPADGAKVDSMDLAKLVYEVKPGPRGDHVHVYVDGKEVGILRQLKGAYTLEALSPGKRRVCIKEVNKAHVPTGNEQCVNLVVN